ncbi:MAG TPA: hypothetical protein VN641_15535 [Urbifossiella sp.]|nr:hypothetical protein [Urbifossiella sp.]
MNWPLPQDFNEAVQNPATAFTDPDLKGGETVVGPTGLPLPRSGNFADVYQIRAADGRHWAVKCFTRPVTGLEERYKKVDEALDRAALPFTISFTFLKDGVMVRGQWMPAVKMEWVDGLLVNQVVRDQAGNPKVLDALGQMWSRLCKRLRESGIAHADIQHGNVLLVPGSKPGSYGLKLIDYDGMYVKSLANTPSGERGHPNYQHPLRAAKQVYSPDLDRFPHLVIATAFKALAVLGPKLWERYDTGDNLLFTDEDFRAPASSKLMMELWQSNNPGLQALVGHLAYACGKPIPQTPWLDQIAPDGIVVPLSLEQIQASAVALGAVAASSIKPVSAGDYGVEAVPAVPVVAAPPHVDPLADLDLEPVRDFDRHRDDDDEDEPRSRRGGRRPAAKAKSPILPIAIAAGVLLFVGGAVGIVALSGKKDDDTAQNNTKNDNQGKENGKGSDDGKGKKPKGNEVPPIPVPTPPVVNPMPPPVDPMPPVNPAPQPPILNVAANLDFKTAGVPDLRLRWQGNMAGMTMGGQFTADGQWVVAREGNLPNAALLSLRNGSRSPTTADGKTPLIGLACLSDGNVVSRQANEPFAMVWSPATGKVHSKLAVRAPEGGQGRRPLFAVSPDGRFVIAGHAGSFKGDSAGRVVVVDSEGGREVLNLPVWGPEFRFTADSKLVVADLDAICTYVLPSGNKLRTANIPIVRRGGQIHGSSRDGSIVLHPGDSGRQRLLIDRGNIHKMINMPLNHINGGVSDDGRLLAICSFPSADNGDSVCHIELMDLAEGRLIGRFPFEDRTVDVQSIAFAPDNSSFIVSRTSRRLQVVEVPKLRPVSPTPPEAVVSVPKAPQTPLYDEMKVIWSVPADATRGQGVLAFSWDGSAIYLASRNPPRGWSCFDARQGQALPRPENLQKIWINGFARLPDDRFAILEGVPPGKIHIWKASTGQVEETLTGFELPPGSSNFIMALSPNRKYLAISRKVAPRRNDAEPNKLIFDTTPLWIYDLTTRSRTEKPWIHGNLFFTADSSRLIVVEGNGEISNYDVATKRFTRTGSINPTNTPLGSNPWGISDDGKLLLYNGRMRTGRVGMALLDAATGDSITDFGFGFQFASYLMAMAADGSVIAGVLSRADHYSIEVFNSRSGKLLARLRFDRDSPAQTPAVALAPDGKRLAVFDSVRQRLTLYALGGQAVAVVPKKVDMPVPVPPPPVVKPKREVLPDAAAITKADAELQQAFKVKYPKPQAKEKGLFARSLLDAADKPVASNPADCYAMLRMARDMGIEISDVPIATQAVDGIIRRFEVNGYQLKQELFDKFAASAGNNTALKLIVEHAIAASDVATASDAFDAGIGLAKSAIAAAKRGSLAPQLKEAETQLELVQKSATAFAAVKSALDRIKVEPNDFEANLRIGRYRCFTQGRWTDGMPMLAKGATGALKTAAELDAATTAAPDAAKLAEAWWTALQAADPLDKRGTEFRMRHWYAAALPKLTGAAKTQAETRLTITAGAIDYVPGVVVEFSAKVPSILKGIKTRVDSAIDFKAEEFKADGAGVATELNAAWSGTLIPQHAGRYRLIVERADNSDPAVLRVDGKTVLILDAKSARSDVLLSLSDRPVAIGLSFKCLNTERHKLRLLWVPPGADTEEPIPPEMLYRERKPK